MLAHELCADSAIEHNPVRLCGTDGCTYSVIVTRLGRRRVFTCTHASLTLALSAHTPWVQLSVYC